MIAFSAGVADTRPVCRTPVINARTGPGVRGWRSKRIVQDLYGVLCDHGSG